MQGLPVVDVAIGIEPCPRPGAAALKEVAAVRGHEEGGKSYHREARPETGPLSVSPARRLTVMRMGKQIEFGHGLRPVLK